MANFLEGAALFILLVNAFSLVRVLRARAGIERMMAVQLLGSGGAALTLLLGAAFQSEPMADVALLLVLLAAFSGTAFTLGLAAPESVTPDRTEGP